MLATIWLVLYTVQALYALQKIRAGFDFYSVLGWIILLAPTYFLARGLIAFAAYRARGSKTRMVAGLLALNPYEEGPQIKKRPKLLNKQRVAVYGLLILAPLPPLVLLLSRLQPQNHMSILTIRGFWEPGPLLHLYSWLCWLGRLASIGAAEEPQCCPGAR